MQKHKGYQNIKEAHKVLDLDCGAGETLEYAKAFLNPKVVRRTVYIIAKKP
ncbi:MAG: hypothetical protein ACK4SM_02235 [Aquificaceae bacterium]